MKCKGRLEISRKTDEHIGKNKVRKEEQQEGMVMDVQDTGSSEASLNEYKII